MLCNFSKSSFWCLDLLNARAWGEVAPPPSPPPFLAKLQACPGAGLQLGKKRGRGGGEVSEWAQNSAGAPLLHHILFFLKCCCTLSYYFLQFLIYIVLLQLPSPHSMHLRPWCNTHGFCKFSVEIQFGLEAFSLNSVFHASSACLSAFGNCRNV